MIYLDIDLNDSDSEEQTTSEPFEESETELDTEEDAKSKRIDELEKELERANNYIEKLKAEVESRKLCGDFNIPGHSYIHGDNEISTTGPHRDHLVNETGEKLRMIANKYDLKSVFGIENVSENMLDLLFHNVRDVSQIIKTMVKTTTTWSITMVWNRMIETPGIEFGHSSPNPLRYIWYNSEIP
ncbi:hypothetical protein QAD02_006701 [Eretmocerus hayati]|uniref:Uncharacterized protein n=1 Tax=Eretmocerus hayati TaxID=131215 RepID=A0ACC2N1W3_9HYME|nr:hypothetical protein QAD02_006701 [Eretmocerus hayati]